MIVEPGSSATSAGALVADDPKIVTAPEIVDVQRDMKEQPDTKRTPKPTHGCRTQGAVFLTMPLKAQGLVGPIRPRR